MRILYDSKALERPGGGIYEYGVQLLTALVDRGDVELFVQIEPGRLPAVLEGKATPLGNYRFRGWRGWGLEGVHAEWLCRRHRIDLYHSLYYVPKPSTRIPSVATCYDFIWERYPRQFGVAEKGVPRLKAQTLTHADQVVCISKSTQRDCGKFLSLEAGVSSVYLGMDEQFSSRSSDVDINVKKTFGLQRPYWIYTGPRYGYKNFNRLWQAFEEAGLKDRFDLVCVGHHDHITLHERDEWAEGMSKAPDHVKLLGFVSEEERLALIRSTFALAYPSEFEGFGLPILEALAAGVPVLCGNQSSLPEVGGDAVEYVDPYDVQDIARGLHKVAGLDGVQLETLIQKGRKQASKFSWKRCADETFAVYQELIESGNGK